MAKVGLALLLLEVQPDQRAADVVRQHAAGRAVQHRHPHHEAGNGDGLPAQRERERARQPPQDADEAGQRDHGVQKAHRQAHRLRGEQVDVFLQALVGVVRLALARMRQSGGAGGGIGRAGVARQLHAVEGLAVQPAAHQLARHPGTPAQLQQLRQVEAVDGDDDEHHRQQREAPQLPPEHGGVLVLQRVVEHAVPFVDLHQHVHRAQVQRHDGRQQATRAPAFVRRAEIRRRQARHLAQEAVKTGKAVRQAHGGWKRWKGSAHASRSPGARLRRG